MKKKHKLLLIYVLTVFIIIILIYKFIRSKIERFEQLEDHNDILFYSYGTEYTKFKTLVTSANANNINIHINGIGIKWKDFSNKLENFHKFLENVDDDKIVMSLDAYDIILYDTAENIKKKFLKYNKPLVFSAEKYCWPDGNIWDKYPKSNEIFKYVNAGTYMGYAWKIKEMLNEFKKTNYNCLTYHTDKYYKKADDQRCLTKYYLNNMNDIAIDNKQKIWSLCAGTKRDDFELKNYNYLYNKITDTQSSILHTNGFNTWYSELYLK
jgi:hypothetical protein